MGKVTPQLIDLESTSAEGGNIIKISNANSDMFFGFGELYSSSILAGHFRGWKVHRRVNSLIFCTQGSMSFHFISSGSCSTVNLENILYSKQALMIPAGIMFGFKSLMEISSVTNLASEPYDADEVERPTLEEHKCGWLQ